MSIEQEIEEGGCAWVSVKGFAICIQTNDEGVEVEIYDEAKLDAGHWHDYALLGSICSNSNQLVKEGANV